MSIACTCIEGRLFWDVVGQTREKEGESWNRERGIEEKKNKTGMLFQRLQVQNMKCVLFSIYESHLDSSICSANGCQKTKLWAKVFFGSLASDPCHRLGCCWM